VARAVFVPDAAGAASGRSRTCVSFVSSERRYRITLTQCRLRLAMGRTRTIGVVVGAIIPAGLYLLFVFHYSVDVPYADDWTIIPLIHSALHGYVSMSGLWSQYGDTRLLVPKLVFVTFGLYDSLNEKSIILFSTVLFVASYLLILLLLRSYLTKPLTFLRVLAVGIVWFSLVDVENALWSFQLAWYLATFFSVGMIYCLLAPHRHKTVFLALGIVAAVAASCSIVQGLIVWPVGLLCLLWSRPWQRRTYYRAGAWSAIAVATTAIYLHGFNTANVECPQTPSCATSYAFLHPVLLGKYLMLLIGNVVPISFYSLHLGVGQFLGLVIFIVAGFVVVKSVRERRNPLPAVLIIFALLFDFLIAIGRIGEGWPVALSSRYTMPNLILLVGIVIYACEHLWAFRFRRVGLGLSGALLVAQCVMATQFGLASGRTTHQAHETDARIVVNLNHIPVAQRGCDLSVDVFPPRSPTVAIYLIGMWRAELAHESLSVFQPSTRRLYRAEGPPTEKEIIEAEMFGPCVTP